MEPVKEEVSGNWLEPECPTSQSGPGKLQRIQECMGWNLFHQISKCAHKLRVCGVQGAKGMVEKMRNGLCSQDLQN